MFIKISLKKTYSIKISKETKSKKSLKCYFEFVSNFETVQKVLSCFLSRGLIQIGFDFTSDMHSDEKDSNDFDYSNISTNIVYPSVAERYFTPRYKISANNENGSDQCILIHSNKLSVITLAISHSLYHGKKVIKKIDFQVDKETNRLSNKVAGKKKHGAQNLNENSILCKIICEDDEVFTVYSCIKGMLVEVNENLIEKPQLLIEKVKVYMYDR
ncbi:DgyrCDS152 [Dimorphilus gyrociliatus]|uniref:DgyrCDS152 n=1 Tax=Dimorphilus gyrociliatus TaxID=2664684 RepID=A0A7I8V839_9ANNE|nr:DgyrCDS152 [Dimorphilus gyrociliatus]